MKTNNHIVIKPWGFEYCAYRNAEVAIWVLEIEQGKATSLHCHPHKNTALIVLRGEIELSFIHDAHPHRLYGLNKINIFRGRFHRTRAVSNNVVLLEVEAPDDKRDILRLDDEYGRVDTPLEEATAPLGVSCLQIKSDKDNDSDHHFAGCFMYTNTKYTLFPFEGVWCSKNTIFVTLTGGLEHGLVPPGDAIDGKTLARFAKTFGLLPNTTFLQIWMAS